MKIIHISTGDTLGGAARSAYRLHEGLGRLGHDSVMFVEYRESNDATVVAYSPPRGPTHRLRRLLRRRRIARAAGRYLRTRQPGRGPFSDDRSQYGADVLSQLPECDVVNLHWVSGFVDLRAFFRAIPSRSAVVWTLHDMNAFTGGCHYDDGCGRFAEECGACPHLGSARERDLSRSIWRRKRNAYARAPEGRLHVVTPSRWLAGEAERSSLLAGRPVSVIPYGLDTEVFTPRGRRPAREALGVPAGARVVMFAAQSVTGRRKGFHLLAEALSGLTGVAGVFLLSLGKGAPPAGPGLAGLHLGEVKGDRMLAIAYSAADLFVIPSLADNLPNTVLEAMACGTPVVGFDVGGVPDMVRPDVTGHLAPVGDTAALARAMAGLLGNDAKRAEMSAACRKVAVAEYSLELQARRYAELYERILSGAG